LKVRGKTSAWKGEIRRSRGFMGSKPIGRVLTTQQPQSARARKRKRY